MATKTDRSRAFGYYSVQDSTVPAKPADHFYTDGYRLWYLSGNREWVQSFWAEASEIRLALRRVGAKHISECTRLMLGIPEAPCNPLKRLLKYVTAR